MDVKESAPTVDVFGDLFLRLGSPLVTDGNVSGWLGGSRPRGQSGLPRFPTTRDGYTT